MNDQPSDSVTLDEAAIQHIRADARSIIAGEGLTQRGAAEECNIAEGTFNAWLAGTYKGHNDKVAGQVAKWIEARAQRKKLKAMVPTPPAYLPIKTAQQIANVLSYAQTLHDMGLVIGPPGNGKSFAAEHYAATNPAVFMATMEPAKASTHHLLFELGNVLKLGEKSSVRISDAIVKRLRDRDALLLIDEAQHLKSEAIDQLRTIHDKARCGIVLMGNETIVGKLGDPERTPQNAQLYSRFGMRLILQRPPAGDVDALLREWKVEDRQEIAFMRVVAAKPGALRALTKTMVAATAIAAGNGETRSIGHLRDAWSRVGAGPIGNS
jgi:DNA transposition AAA+ family ATPase